MFGVAHHYSGAVLVIYQPKGLGSAAKLHGQVRLHLEHGNDVLGVQVYSGIKLAKVTGKQRARQRFGVLAMQGADTSLGRFAQMPWRRLRGRYKDHHPPPPG